jgi:predicted GNAT superfamily acetyltransferase
VTTITDAVVVRTLDRIADIAAAEALFAATWPGQPPATAGLMRALEHAGGYVAGAYLGDTLVGAAAAFLASHPTPGLHSHVAAVTPTARGRGVGYALKIHQRAWAAERGLQTVTWTFDPVVRRNAWFNIGKLGVGIGEYLVDFYGRMDDGINNGDESDRLLAVWPVEGGVHDRTGLHDHRGVEGEVGVALEEVEGRPVVRDTVNGRDGGHGGHGEDGEDCGHGGDGGDGGLVAVATPPDVETLRRTDPALAHAWRIAVREALEPRLRTGRIVGFTRAGSYLVTTAELRPRSPSRARRP